MSEGTISPQEASRRRRAVYHGVHEILSEQDTAAAVSLCDHEFLMTKVLTATAFISRLSEIILLGDKQHSIHSSLVIALMLKADQLPPDPLSAAPPAAAPSATLPPVAATPSPQPPAGTSSQSDEEVVFHTLIQQVCDQLRRQDASQMTTIGGGISQLASASKLPKAVQADICAWSAKLEQGAIHSGMTSESFKSAVQMLYVWSCQAFGPTLTDKVFGQAVRTTEQLPQSAACSPRQFL